MYSKTAGENINILCINNPRSSNSSVYFGDEYNHYSSSEGSKSRENYYQGDFADYISYSNYPYQRPNINYDTRSYSNEYIDHNVSQYYNTSYNQAQENTNYHEEDSSRFFRIDTIQQDGVERSFHTPINPLNAPVMNNNTTPTITPLFSSNKVSESSLAYSNGTTHATIGPNKPESYEN